MRIFVLLFIQAILVSSTGWANAATIDVIYDLLHMMGRDDIPVGLGDVFAMNQSDPIFSAVGNCKYSKAIPYGSGGFLDSDTLYGLARSLPRSPRRYLQVTTELDGHLPTSICQPLLVKVGISNGTLKLNYLVSTMLTRLIYNHQC